MTDEIRGPWIKRALLAHLNDEDPERENLQIVSIDKEGRPDCVSDKKHHIRCIFEDAPVKAILNKYRGAPSLKGAVMLPLEFLFQHDIDSGEFVLHVTDFKILGSIGSNVFGTPSDIHNDEEVSATIKKLMDPSLGSSGAPDLYSQQEDQLYREDYIVTIANDVAAREGAESDLTKQKRIFTRNDHKDHAD
eukprot:jgi/Bigna1/82368/fgenesh1_pg.91_\